MVTTANLYDLYLKSGGVCTDTRQIVPGVIFFALKGANFNGNAFADQALQAGAAFVVIDEEQYKKDDRYLLVEDGLTALQQLALYHRRQFRIPFIAVTGSNGKTTTKELINAVLSAQFKTYATRGNLNNHIGIPLTILSIKKDAEMAIIEMGANHQKEIEGYCRIAEPTHGIITNIGKAHLEGFGGFEGVKKGKGELYDYLLRTSGFAFINSANPILMEMNKFSNAILYPNDFYKCSLAESDPFIKVKAENGEVITTHLIGAYNFDNIAAALCIGKYFRVPEGKANAAVAGYVPDNNRSQLMEKGSNKIILDAYNANPSSMKAALENFGKLIPAYKVAILGDMFELGEESELEHRKLGELINTLKLQQVIFCGKNMKNAHDQVLESLYFPARPELEEYLKTTKYSHAHILVKGSRGMGLEKVVEYL
jgi:UDP-N-acetylmuramoyl-tripeptide--D-alanyl-D-alanine ligase